MKTKLLLILILAAAANLRAEAPKPEYAFLTERVSISTDDGLIGIPPGTRVLVVARKEGSATVKVATHQFDVEVFQLTTDPNAASAIARQDAAAQQASKQTAPQMAEPPTLPAGATSGDQLRALQKQRTLIGLQIEQLNEQMRQYPAYTPNSKMSANAARNKQQRDAIKAQIDGLQAKLRQIRQQETLIRLGNQ